MNAINDDVAIAEFWQRKAKLLKSDGATDRDAIAHVAASPWMNLIIDGIELPPAADIVVVQELAGNMHSTILPSLCIDVNRDFKDLVAEARNNRPAFDGLRSLCAINLRQNPLLNRALIRVAADILSGDIVAPKAKPGPSKNAKSSESFFIATLVFEVVELGYDATRNDQPRTDGEHSVSACDIVMAALAQRGRTVSFSKVKKAWTQTQKTLRTARWADIV